MEQHYKDVDFRPETLALIRTIDGIIKNYQAQGFTLTVRQLYYQLVAQAIIENTERSYKRITGIVNDARLAGYLDWDAIEDRTREFVRLTRWESGAQILDAAARSFHMDMWKGQPARAFVIVEKEALVGVLEAVCRTLDVPLLAARGYPSGTVLREFCVEDLLTIGEEQTPTIFHLGDHDPSGIDMSRDLEERIEMFCERRVGFEFHRIALNMDQIQKQKPPPNPAKMTDSRFKEYLRRHGSKSWELDALSPTFLANLVRKNVMNIIDRKVWNAREEEVESIRAGITKVAKEFAVA